LGVGGGLGAALLPHRELLACPGSGRGTSAPVAPLTWPITVHFAPRVG